MSIQTPALESFEDRSAADVLAWALETYGSRFAIVSSFQAEGMVVIDLARRLRPDVRVITLDTGRLPAETFELIDQIRGRWDIAVEVKSPEPEQVEAMVSKHGVNLFYRDQALRRLCCQVRKVFPLERALKGLDAWAAGLRRDQAPTRAKTPKVEIDERHGGILKINPLADWSREQVWGYIREHGVPTNALYEQGYRSIGCAPCTRPANGEDGERAGRWWWEADADKECGLHHSTPDERFSQELEWLRSATE
jgi:thioredoxin-dependent adenylylsulfate APS reductase